MDLEAAPFVWGLAAVIGGLAITQALRRGFDPFAPIWMFLAGYTQVYVVQAISYRPWALNVRGPELVAAADFRAFWALIWFLVVYYSPVGRVLARGVPAPPAKWSITPVLVLTPALVVWGMFCANLEAHADASAEKSLLLSFPFMMQVGGLILLVTGRNAQRPRPMLTMAGLGVIGVYLLIWMFNGKRSHALIAILTGVAGFYIPKLRRPSKLVLAVTAVAVSLVVALAIGWRGNNKYERSASGFAQYVTEFRPDTILEALNFKERQHQSNDPDRPVSYETEEWGGFLLMLDTVPQRSSFDYGSPYLRIFTIYIPRLIWKDKPVFGRVQWQDAWIAGSEFPRDRTFTGPAIGVLGAAQLNGGAVATAIVMAGLALLIRTAYEVFRLYADRPWAQVFWSATFVNAWFMTVNDDPFIWFHYIYGFTTLPVLVLFFAYNKLADRGEAPAQGPSWHPGVAPPVGAWSGPVGAIGR